LFRPPSDSARASDSMFCIDFVRVTNCFYDYDYDTQQHAASHGLSAIAELLV